MKKINVILTVFLLVFSLNSCKKDDIGVKEDISLSELADFCEANKRKTYVVNRVIADFPLSNIAKLPNYSFESNYSELLYVNELKVISRDDYEELEHLLNVKKKGLTCSGKIILQNKEQNRDELIVKIQNETSVTFTY